MGVGIEAMNFFGGSTVLDVRTLFQARGLDLERFNNLMMEKKSVGLPCEDPVTNAVNAAKPVIDKLSADEKNRIELVISASETGLDFGKAIGTYVHDYLGLSRNCRIFEIKEACYGGTASLQMAANFVASGASPGAKALIVSTDVARAAAKMTYAEPSQGTGGIAMLVSDKPHIFELDFGANGYHAYEVMDTCRPEPNIETGDPDLSLLSYLDCLDKSYKMYSDRVEGVDIRTTFDYFAFHTPFGGMVKGAHRNLMRKNGVTDPKVIEEDFQRRVLPSFKYCVQVGNVYSATAYLALCGLIDTADLTGGKRIGIFSYGSGCSSEFYSGTATENSKRRLGEMMIGERLRQRYDLNMEEYDKILDLSMEWMFGVKDKEVDIGGFAKMYDHFFRGKGLLVLKRVKNYHREYEWS